MKTLLLQLMLFFGLFLAVSCGLRKTQKTEVKEVVKTEAESNKTGTTETEKKTNTEIKSENKKDVSNDISETDELLEPVNPDKPIIKTESEKDGIKTTTWENAKVKNLSKTDNSKTNESSISKEKISENENTSHSNKSDLNIKAESNKSDESKVTEADKGFGFSLWWLWLLLIPLGLWRLYKIK